MAIDSLKRDELLWCSDRRKCVFETTFTLQERQQPLAVAQHEQEEEE